LALNILYDACASEVSVFFIYLYLFLHRINKR